MGKISFFMSCLAVFFYGLTASAQGILSMLNTGSCSNVPSQVQKALQESQSFSQSCPTARLAAGKYYVINDYSGLEGPAMYIFAPDGNCVKSVPITWGNGAGGAIKACSTDSSHQTPPGFHMTARHDGAAYNQSNCLGLAGLSGQNSLGERGVLIHPAQQPGTASSWGCTGVPMDQFSEIQQMLGVGSLVYNYFGDNPDTSGCSDTSGFKPTCEPEAEAVQAESEATGMRASGYRAAPSGGGSRGGSQRGSNQ